MESVLYPAVAACESCPNRLSRFAALARATSVLTGLVSTACSAAAGAGAVCTAAAVLEVSGEKDFVMSSAARKADLSETGTQYVCNGLLPRDSSWSARQQYQTGAG